MRLALRLALLTLLAGALPAAAEPTRARLATLSDESASARGPELLPRGLAAADLARYRQIFALQRQRDWPRAERLIGELEDDLLLGHVLAARYLAPKSPRADYAELAGWLERWADLPQAPRIHKLALGRKPAGAAKPRAPSPSPTAVRASSGRTASRLGVPARRPPPPIVSPDWPTTPGSIRPPRRAPRSGPHAPICALAGHSWSCRCCGSRPKAATILRAIGAAHARRRDRVRPGRAPRRQRHARPAGALPRDPAGPGPGRRGRAGAGRRRDAAPCLARTLRPRPGPGRDRPHPGAAFGPAGASPARAGRHEAATADLARVGADRRLPPRPQPAARRDPRGERLRPGRPQPQGCARPDADHAGHRRHVPSWSRPPMPATTGCWRRPTTWRWAKPGCASSRPRRRSRAA